MSSPLLVPALPALAGLHLDTLVTTDATISITAASTASFGVCPDCGASSTRIHSAYIRRPRDVPWGGLPVQFALRVRRFFCDTPACQRTTFTEQIAGLTRPYAQRTIGLNAALQTLGLALGGEAGARVGDRLGMVGSADTILRRVAHVVPESMPAPRIVGIDEWAIRKGRRYGSIIVDLEHQRPIALLPDHAADPITAWFQAHPSVEVIARDRASLYADALATGAPQAQQVADRWHLLQNLGTALQDFLARQTKALRAVAHTLTGERQASHTQAQPNPPTTLEPAPPGHIVGPLELRRHQFSEAKRLHADGWSYRRIAAELQLNRRTVRNYIHADELPRRILPQSTSSVTPYLAQLREHWAAGCRQGTHLLVKLQAHGYRGSISSIYRVLRRMQRGDGLRHQATAAVERVAIRSPRQAMWLLIREEHDLADEDVVYRTALCAHDPLIDQAATLGRRFQAMVRQRVVDDLDPWLTDAEASGIKELRNFAQSLRRDYQPVKAALTSHWSNGQTEGHVNRLKMIKRTMYGRASFDVLRNRVLYAP